MSSLYTAYHRTRALMKAYISVYVQNITIATICCLLSFFSYVQYQVSMTFNITHQSNQ